MMLGETLVTHGVITQKQLEAALSEQKKNPKEKIGEILLKLGYLPKDELQLYV